MGYSTDLFTTEPAAGCICAICHDVLKDASSFVECGHTFCNSCINASLMNDNDSCPNCRAEVSGEVRSSFIDQRNDWEVYAQHTRYVNDCRNWIEHKPDALFDVRIYQIKKSQMARHLVTGLICYIPGPTGSSWEGAMIPMVLRHKMAMQPPRCRFPAGFFHPMIYPSGTVCLDILNEEDRWTSEITLAEILFGVQQLLAHPNWGSPTQAAPYHMCMNDGPEQYQQRVQEEAKKYPDLVKHHQKCKGWFEEGELIDEEDIIERAEKGNAKKKERPTPPPFTTANRDRRVLYEGCDCSCCAWGQTYWDDKGKMRFLKLWHHPHHNQTPYMMPTPYHSV